MMRVCDDGVMRVRLFSNLDAILTLNDLCICDACPDLLLLVKSNFRCSELLRHQLSDIEITGKLRSSLPSLISSVVDPDLCSLLIQLLQRRCLQSRWIL